jgi:membrane fusion protein PltH
MTRRVVGILLGVTVAATVAALGWRSARQRRAAPGLVLHGNVDLRQVDLPFNNSERIAAVFVQEGDYVHAGQLLARLDTRRLEPQLMEAQAEAAAQRDVVARLHHGSRPEEIAQARANVVSARADAANAEQLYDRLSALSSGTYRAVSAQDLDNARAAVDVARAKRVVNERALDLAIAGPRREDIEQATAQLESEEAHVAFLREQVTDADLLAPTNAVVRSRLMEPGELASPGRPVFSLAITDPKWVRAYVSEAELGRVHSGMPAAIEIDSYPGRRFAGWVGFISSVAEFTPKSVETEELRTSLVYEVRVFVRDSSDVLRLGMPATVVLAADSVRAAPPARDERRRLPVARDSQ